MSVQAEVERPFTYLLARCPASSQQLGYSSIRKHDVMLLNETKFEVDGVKFGDKMRFFKGIAIACRLYLSIIYIYKGNECFVLYYR